ncbi:MAG: DUF4173 domain-containing protein [Verrucomicrobiae bacterium]|nr:DUF4173 domain-containing protein [Verrucomicrobiae bacterium]
MITKSMIPPALPRAVCFPDERSQALTPGRLLTGAGLLTIAADVLLWNSAPGAGLAVFSLLVWCGLLWNRQSAWEMLATPKGAIAVSLMLATAAQTAIEPGFANGCLLIALTVYASGHFLHDHFHPYWRRFLEGISGLLWFPVALLSGRFWLRQWIPFGGISPKPEAGRTVLRFVWAALPAALICVPFALLLLGGNAVMFSVFGDLIESLETFFNTLEAPDIVRVLFWGFVSAAMLALLGKGEPSRVLRWIGQRVPTSLPVPADLDMGIWRTRLLLIAVNVLFFFANTTDVLYLWADAALPAGVTASAFVHHGVYSLIASVLLAALVLSLLWVQAPAVCRARGQRWLAHLWIVQNLVLVGSVVLRLKLYVEFYQMSLLRVYVVCFLVLVSVGFVLLAIRVHQERTMSWLLGANVLGVFGLFFVMQCWDEHRFVANWNIDAARSDAKSGKTLDTAYLGSLGPAAWPGLYEVASQPEVFGRWATADAKTILTNEAEQYENRMATGGWRAWQWRQHVAAQHFAINRKLAQ